MRRLLSRTAQVVLIVCMAAGCSGDDDKPSHYCCTLQNLCNACVCDASERTIARANDEAACQQLLDTGSFACSDANEASALAACLEGEDIARAPSGPSTVYGPGVPPPVPPPGMPFGPGAAGVGAGGAPMPAQDAGSPVTGSPGVCGDGMRSDPEQCDGDDLGGFTCATAPDSPGPGGTLTCNVRCERDLSGCMAVAPTPAADGEPCETADQCLSGVCCEASGEAARTCGPAQGCPARTGDPCDPARVDACIEGRCEPGGLDRTQPGFCTADCQIDEDCGMHGGGGNNVCFKLGPASSIGNCAPDCTGDCAHLDDGFTCVSFAEYEICQNLN